MKKTIRFLAGISVCAVLNSWADSQVTVYSPGQTQTTVVSHAKDLAELVRSPELAGKTWWPGTVISEKMATTAALRQQQQILARLNEWRSRLKADNDSELAAVVDRMYQQLAAIRVTGRLKANLDPDWVRVRPGANRPLEGVYQVYTLNKPNSVTLAGVVASGGQTPWRPGRSVREYLDDRARLPGAERNVAVLIAPDGKVSEVPVAYWNHRHVEPEPGSIIYVGFSSWTLPGAYEDLNQQIVSVLTHRIPD